MKRFIRNTNIFYNGYGISFTVIIVQYYILYVGHNDNIMSSSKCQHITAYHTSTLPVFKRVLLQLCTDNRAGRKC